MGFNVGGNTSLELLSTSTSNDVDRSKMLPKLKASGSLPPNDEFASLPKKIVLSMIELTLLSSLEFEIMFVCDELIRYFL